MECRRSPFEKSFTFPFCTASLHAVPYRVPVAVVPSRSFCLGRRSWTNSHCFLFFSLCPSPPSSTIPRLSYHSSHSNSSGSLVGRALKDPYSHRWWRLCHCAAAHSRCPRELQNSYGKIFFCYTLVKVLPHCFDLSSFTTLFYSEKFPSHALIRATPPRKA
jgi:hypothetical protein